MKMEKRWLEEEMEMAVGVENERYQAFDLGWLLLPPGGFFSEIPMSGINSC